MTASTSNTLSALEDFADKAELAAVAAYNVALSLHGTLDYADAIATQHEADALAGKARAKFAKARRAAARVGGA